MTASGSQHPLAYLADVFFAAIAMFVLIALCLTIAAIVRDVRGWWRGRKRRPRLRDLMDDGDGQGGVPPLPRRTRPLPLGGHVIPLFRDPARDCEFCAPRYNGAADCGCPVPCDDPGCGALLWAAVANTEEMER